MHCTCCEEEFEDVSDGRENDAGAWYCDDCYDDRYEQCDGCQCEVVSAAVFSDDGEYYCDGCVDTYYFTCSHCGDRESVDDATVIFNGSRICEGCRIGTYSFCDCCSDWVHDSNWCSDCETCDECCRCDYCGDCGEHSDNCMCHMCEDCDEHNEDCTCEEPDLVPIVVPIAPPPTVSPFRDNGGSPVSLIERLDNSKFELLPANVDKVLGMLGNKGKLSSIDILGSLCTGDGGYYLLADIIRDVGKVAAPKYLYGVRSKEYDIVISREGTSDVLNATTIRKLSSLGLTYTYTSSTTGKVGLSFKVRKRRYRKCVEFLKFYCNV